MAKLNKTGQLERGPFAKRLTNLAKVILQSAESADVFIILDELDACSRDLRAHWLEYEPPADDPPPRP